ncbi:MAG: CHASE sensor domain-containing protein, partial [Caulobacterales bacterium]
MLLIAGLLLGVVNEIAYRSQQLREIEIQANTLAQSVAAPLMFVDSVTAQENANAFGFNPQIDAVGIYDSAGDVLASYQK